MSFFHWNTWRKPVPPRRYNHYTRFRVLAAITETQKEVLSPWLGQRNDAKLSSHIIMSRSSATPWRLNCAKITYYGLSLMLVKDRMWHISGSLVTVILISEIFYKNEANVLVTYDVNRFQSHDILLRFKISENTEYNIKILRVYFTMKLL